MTMKTPAATNTGGKKSGGERRQKRVRDNSSRSVCPHSVCLSAASIMSREKLRIPLTSLGPDSCRRRHIEWSSSLYLSLFLGEGWVTPNCVWVHVFKESLLGHTLSLLLSATIYSAHWKPWKQDVFHSLPFFAHPPTALSFSCCCPYHTGAHFRRNQRGQEESDP